MSPVAAILRHPLTRASEAQGTLGARLNSRWIFGRESDSVQAYEQILSPLENR
jgi:hypothetical protein